MRHEEKRRQLSDQLRSEGQFSEAEIEVLAMATHPWSDGANGTYDFFLALGQLHQEWRSYLAEKSPKATKEAFLQRARQTLNSYADLADSHGCGEYAATFHSNHRPSTKSAAHATFSHVPQAEPRTHKEASCTQQISAPLNRTLPAYLRLSIRDHELHLDQFTGDDGHHWYTLAGQSGRPSRPGLILVPLNPALPSHLTLQGQRLLLGKCPTQDAQGRKSLGKFEPTSIKRETTAKLLLANTPYLARIRVTRRKDNRWNVTARVWPEGESSMVAYPAPESPQQTACPRDTSTQSPMQRIRRLLIPDGEL